MPITTETGTVYRVVDEGTAAILKIADSWSKLQVSVDVVNRSIDLTMAKIRGLADSSSALDAVGKAAKAQAAVVDSTLGLSLENVAKASEAMSARAAASFATIDSAIGNTDKMLAGLVTSFARVRAASEGLAVGGSEGLAARARGAASLGSASHGTRGGLHVGAFRRDVLGMHMGVRPHGDGLGELAGGLILGDLTKQFIESQAEMQKWTAQLATTAKTASDVPDAISAAWLNARNNVNTTAVDSIKNIVELNKVTGDIHQSIALLPAFTSAQIAMRSVKSEDLKTKLDRGTQSLNLARAVEEMGVVRDPGKSPEENAAATRSYVQDIMRTIVSSRGLIDGDQMFALTNNSGGQAENWDQRMATVVAPIIGEVMRATKAGNADYMSIRAFEQGQILPKAVYALKERGLVSDSDIHYNPASGKVDGLMPNNSFGSGLTKNAWEWSKGILEKLKSQGVDTSDQDTMYKIINEWQLNKTVGNFMRTLLEPKTRAMIESNMNARDRTPADAAGFLQESDPALKMEALKDKWKDLMTVLGGPITDGAIKILTDLTSSIATLSNFLRDHPEVASFAATSVEYGAIFLTVSGGLKLLTGLLTGPGSVGAAAEGLAAVLGGSLLPAISAVIAVGVAAKVIKMAVDGEGAINAIPLTPAQKSWLAQHPGDPNVRSTTESFGPVGGPFTNRDRIREEREAARRRQAAAEQHIQRDDSYARPPGLQDYLDDNGLQPLLQKTDFVVDPDRGFQATASDMFRQFEDAVYRGTLRAFTEFSGGATGALGGGSGGLMSLASFGGGGGSDAAAGPSNITGDQRSRANHAISQLMALGWTKEAAASAVGQFVTESGVTSNGVAGDHGTAHGLAQWRFERFEALKRFAAARGKPWTDFDTQIQFFDAETKTHGGANWRYTHDLMEGNRYGKHYEGYGSNTFGQRYSNSRSLLDGFSPGVPAKPPTVVHIHHNTHVDGEIVAQNTSKHLLEDNMHTHGPSTHDDFAHYAPADTSFG